MNRRSFIKTGLLFVPTIFTCRAGSVRMGNLDPDTYDWMQRVTANTGTYNSISVVASDTGLKMIKAAGLRSKILRLGFFCGNGFKAGLTPHIKDKGATYDTKTGATDATGVAYAETQSGHGGFLALTAAVDFVDTGLNPSTDLSTNDVHLAVYSGGTAGGQDSIPIGVALADAFFLTMSYSGIGQTTNIWSGTGRPSTADSNGNGFYMGTRVGSGATDVHQYKNGVATGDSSSVSGSPPNASVYVTAANAGGGGPIGQSTAHWIQGYSMGTKLVAAEVLAFDNIFQTVNRILSRKAA